MLKGLCLTISIFQFLANSPALADSIGSPVAKFEDLPLKKDVPFDAVEWSKGTNRLDMVYDLVVSKRLCDFSDQEVMKRLGQPDKRSGTWCKYYLDRPGKTPWEQSIWLCFSLHGRPGLISIEGRRRQEYSSQWRVKNFSNSNSSKTADALVSARKPFENPNDSVLHFIFLPKMDPAIRYAQYGLDNEERIITLHTFEPEVWKTKPWLREYMVRDLIHSQPLVGMSRDQVRSLLGMPAMRVKPQFELPFADGTEDDYFNLTYRWCSFGPTSNNYLDVAYKNNKVVAFRMFCEQAITSKYAVFVRQPRQLNAPKKDNGPFIELPDFL